LPWTQAVSAAASGENVSIWYYPDNPGGITDVNVTISAANSVRGELSAWRGIHSVDRYAYASASASDSLTISVSGTDSALAVTAFGEKLSLGETLLFTPGSGWTNLANDVGSSTNFHHMSDYLLAPPIGSTVSESVKTMSVQADWVGAIATFR
jgi:hypothetical protein